MSKVKSVGKWKLFTAIAALVVIAGIVLLAVLGFNKDTSFADAKTLTVKMNAYAYSDRLERVEKICEDEFKSAGLSYTFEEKGETTGDSDEIVYVFKSGTDTAKLNAAAESLQKKFDEVTNPAYFSPENPSDLLGMSIQTGVNTEKVAANTFDGFWWRAILAAGVILVIEFIYVAVRYKLNMGAAVALSSLVGLLLTLSITVITRIPVTSSFIYVAAISMLLPAVFACIVFNRMRVNFKTEEYKALSAEETVSSSVPYKTLGWFTVAALVALALVGGIAAANVRWFALGAIAALVSGWFAAVLWMPAIYLPMKKHADKKAAERARYDYKKGANKEEEKSEKAE